jgi:hypothetical protein
MTIFLTATGILEPRMSSITPHPVVVKVVVEENGDLHKAISI